MASEASNVKVIVRVRPLNDEEKKQDRGQKCCEVYDNRIEMLTSRFEFDSVEQEHVSQDTIFDKIARPVCEDCMNGFNGSVIALGKTGTGKTWTIHGDEQYMKLQGPNRGILSRISNYVYSKAAEKTTRTVSYEISVQQLEICMEKIYDLMAAPSRQKEQLQIKEDLNQGIIVQGLADIECRNLEEMCRTLQEGIQRRQVGTTGSNRNSSRSHNVTIIHIVRKEATGQGAAHKMYSKFNIVDLAGNERQKETQATGNQLAQGSAINRSWLAMGNVITALVAKGDRGGFVPFRDTKLTHLLKDSLGGNFKTNLIANISQSAMAFNDTKSTLNLAQKAKAITVMVSQNADVEGNVHQLRAEIKSLRHKLAQWENSSGQVPNYAPLPSDTQSLKPMSIANMERPTTAALSQDAEKTREKISALVREMDSIREESEFTVQQQVDEIAHLQKVDKAKSKTIDDLVQEVEKKNNMVQSMKAQLDSGGAQFSGTGTQDSAIRIAQLDAELQQSKQQEQRAILELTDARQEAERNIMEVEHSTDAVSRIQDKYYKEKEKRQALKQQLEDKRQMEQEFYQKNEVEAEYKMQCKRLRNQLEEAHADLDAALSDESVQAKHEEKVVAAQEKSRITAELDKSNELCKVLEESRQEHENLIHDLLQEMSDSKMGVTAGAGGFGSFGGTGRSSDNGIFKPIIDQITSLRRTPPSISKDPVKDIIEFIDELTVQLMAYQQNEAPQERSQRPNQYAQSQTRGNPPPQNRSAFFG